MELHFAKGFSFQCAGYCWCCCMQPVVVCVRGRRDENSARIQITIVCIRSEWKQTRFAYITYGNSETCNKSLFEPIQMHRRCSMLMDSSNRIRLSNHHIVYLNYVWERIVNSSLSIRSEVFCEKLSIYLSATINIWFNDENWR